MIEALKIECENVVGFKIKGRGDCEFLANSVLELVDEEISYNTLRRLYGLSKGGGTSKRTLNILSKFIGYKNFTDFTLNYNYKDDIKISEMTYQLISKANKDDIFDFVRFLKKSPTNFVSQVILLVRELIYLEEFELLDDIFQLDEFQFDSFTYSELLHIGNSIGLLFRRVHRLPDCLLLNLNFAQCVFMIFVDYSSLNKFYGAWISRIIQYQCDKEVLLFSKSILAFTHFLMKKDIIYDYRNEAFNRNLHPILCSRILSVNLFVADPSSILPTIDEYFVTHNLNRALGVEYMHEVFIASMLTKNFDVMEYLIKLFDGNSKLDYYYQKHHYNLFHLMCLFYYKKQVNRDLERYYLKKFSLKEVRYNYLDFVKLIHLIYRYHSATSLQRKSDLKHDYQVLANHLDYALFDFDFLEHYFV